MTCLALYPPVVAGGGSDTEYCRETDLACAQVHPRPVQTARDAAGPITFRVSSERETRSRDARQVIPSEGFTHTQGGEPSHETRGACGCQRWAGSMTR